MTYKRLHCSYAVFADMIRPKGTADTMFVVYSEPDLAPTQAYPGLAKVTIIAKLSIKGIKHPRKYDPITILAADYMHHTTKGMENLYAKILEVHTKHHIVSGRKLLEDLYDEVNKNEAPKSTVVTIHEKTPKHRRATTVIIGTTESSE